jgi:hypothetical protein
LAYHSGNKTVQDSVAVLFPVLIIDFLATLKISGRPKQSKADLLGTHISDPFMMGSSKREQIAIKKAQNYCF